jgi:hypothetical protein
MVSQPTPKSQPFSKALHKVLSTVRLLGFGVLLLFGTGLLLWLLLLARLPGTP